MRYFLELGYKGTHFHGWQKQPNAVTVQGRIEEAFYHLMKTDVAVVGCGRTDSGVHARHFVAHFDMELKRDPYKLLRGINALVGEDIVVYNLSQVENDAHARFDALSRTYCYHLILEKNPFLRDFAFQYNSAVSLNVRFLNQAARVLLDYDAYYPFSKSHTDVKHYRCVIEEVSWERITAHHFVFRIKANRFLRGMVRLIVGMCLRVSEEKLDLAMVRNALDQQKRLPQDWSVPARGLFLTHVMYPKYFNLLPDKGEKLPCMI